MGCEGRCRTKLGCEAQAEHCKSWMRRFKVEVDDVVVEGSCCWLRW